MPAELGIVLRAVLALAFVLALIAAATWAARRYFGGVLFGAIGGARRLAVIESLVLDGKHRLVLTRRDDTEHLLVLGPSGAVLVETRPMADDAKTGAPGEVKPVPPVLRSVSRSE